MSDLPSDPALLRQTVMALSLRLAALSEECSTLATERDAAIAQRDAAIQENDKLLMILSQYKRTIFGPRSDTGSRTAVSLHHGTGGSCRRQRRRDRRRAA